MLETRQELDIFEIRDVHSDRLIDQAKLQELVNSILENGLISPITVGPDQDLLAGFYRLEAYKSLYKSHGDTYRHIPVRMANSDDQLLQSQLNASEKIFHPELSILEKAGHFKKYFDDLKYGQMRHKTTTIFKTLDISRRTFFNLRAIAERLTPAVQERILSSSLRPLSNSTPQLLALCKFEAEVQLEILNVMETHQCSSVFEAIKLHQQTQHAVELQKSRQRKFLKSQSLKLDKELRQELLKLSEHSGQGQNELFNEIFEAGLELIEQKYR